VSSRTDHLPLPLCSVSQLFFHKFFAQKLNREKARASKTAKRKGGNDSDADDAADMEGGEGSDDEDLPRSNTPAEDKKSKAATAAELAVEPVEEEDSEDEFEKEVWKVGPPFVGQGAVRGASDPFSFLRLFAGDAKVDARAGGRR
jgi:hypothetical protein